VAKLCKANGALYEWLMTTAVACSISRTMSVLPTKTQRGRLLLSFERIFDGRVSLCSVEAFSCESSNAI
jgi:hypothetical protein